MVLDKIEFKEYKHNIRQALSNIVILQPHDLHKSEAKISAMGWEEEVKLGGSGRAEKMTERKRWRREMVERKRRNVIGFKFERSAIFFELILFD